MKSFIILVMSVSILLSSCRTNKTTAQSEVPETVQPAPQSGTNFSDPTTWVLGYFNRQMLSSPPHSEWFMKGYDDYNFNSDAVNKLTEISKEGISIKIVLGSWCPDSRREVPRFMRITDIWKFPADKITWIGVDNSKLSPVGEYESLNIQRVPTFIIYKNNVEAGRIIENPVASLEQDIVNILIKE